MSVIHIQEAKKKMKTLCVFQRVEEKYLLNEEQLKGWNEAMLIVVYHEKTSPLFNERG